jgi:hypothetical protein
MNKLEGIGTVPGWTLLVGLLGWVIAPMIMLICRDFGLLWMISIAPAIVVAVAGSFAGRWLDRKYSAPRPHK